MLDEEQRAAYDRDGFLVLPDVVPAADCARLIARAEELVDAFEPPPRPSVFSTEEQTRVSDEYFLASGDRISFFFEEKAFGPDGSLQQPKSLSINKIGHAQHDLDPVFREFSRAPRLAELARDLGFRDPRLIQSMYIFKQPSIGGEVGSHQDATFLYTEPVTVTGFWFALQDATLENGCLWAAPGGHRGPLRKRFRRLAGDADGTVMDVLDETPLPSGPADGLVPLEVAAGTLVVLNGLLPHWSGANTSPRSRHAYTLHLVDGTADYPADNWLRRATPPTGF